MTNLKNDSSNENKLVIQHTSNIKSNDMDDTNNHHHHHHPLFITQDKIELKPGLQNVPLPNTIHATIQTQERVIIIGDVHGCISELKTLLQKCKWTKKDVVILVGDLMSKGPYPIETLRFIQEYDIYCVRGNHDDAALRAFYELQTNDDDDKRNEIMKKYGYTMHFSEKDVQFLQELPFTIYLPYCNSLVVHAGLVPNVPLQNQQPKDMYKMRDVIEITHNKTNDETLKHSSYQTAYKKNNENRNAMTIYHPWASKWNGPYHIYFGHDAKRGLQRYEYATGLDTGCCYGNRLSAVILGYDDDDERDIVSVDAERVYEKPGGGTN